MAIEPFDVNNISTPIYDLIQKIKNDKTLSKKDKTKQLKDMCAVFNYCYYYPMLKRR